MIKKIYYICLVVYVFLFLGAVPHEYDLTITLPANMAVVRWYEPEPERCLVPPRRNVPEEYRALIEYAAAAAGIPPGVLEAIACVESGFTPSAKSPIREDGNRDLGMFQFNSRYLDWFSEKYNSGVPFDPFDPVEAAIVAARHLRLMYVVYGHWPTVFLAYNAGMGAVGRDEVPDSSFRYLALIYSGGHACE